MSSLMLLHSSAQLLPHGFVQHARLDLSHAKLCVEVLKYCGQVDQVAYDFAQSASSYHQRLLAEVEQVQDAVYNEADGFKYLFHTPTTPPLGIPLAAKELLRLVTQPFGSPDATNFHKEGILKAGFGGPDDWNMFVGLPFNRIVPAQDQKLPLEMVLSSIQEGEFLGASLPHGWDSLTQNNKI